MTETKQRNHQTSQSRRMKCLKNANNSVTEENIIIIKTEREVVIKQ